MCTTLNFVILRDMYIISSEKVCVVQYPLSCFLFFAFCCKLCGILLLEVFAV